MTARRKALHNHLDELRTARKDAAKWDQPAALSGTKRQHAEQAKQSEAAHDGSAEAAHNACPAKERVVEVELHSGIVSNVGKMTLAFCQRTRVPSRMSFGSS